jgi:hypothetical protein
MVLEGLLALKHIAVNRIHATDFRSLFFAREIVAYAVQAYQLLPLA